MTTGISAITKTIEVIPTVSSGAAYTANDAVGGVQTLTAVVVDTDDFTSILQSLVVVDSSVQSAALTIFFFDRLPTIASADNAAFDLTDANVQFCIGHVTVAAADYQTSASNSVACVKNIGLRLKCNEVAAATNSRSMNLYAAVKTTGTPTYASTTALTFKYSFDA